MRKKIFNIFKSFGETLFQLMKHQPFVIVATITCFFLFSFFGEVVDDVLEGDSHAIDEKILLMLRDPENVQSPLGPGWLDDREGLDSAPRADGGYTSGLVLHRAGDHR